MCMSESLFLRIKSLNVKSMHGVSAAKNVIRVAAMHNLRELVAEFGARADSGIDPARMALNYQLRGPATAAGVADLALALLANAGVQKLRKDACMALEVVFSLPPGSAVDQRKFFAAAVAWADAFFNVPILSAAVHLDEAAPHCHVLLLPLVGGRMKGGALAGGPTRIKMMLSDFQQQVGQRFGLTHQPRAKRISKASKDAAGRLLLDALKSHPERFNLPAVRDVLVAALGAHHEALLPLMGLTLPTPTARRKTTFAAIMTAPCKPERTPYKRTSIDVAKSTSIDVAPQGADVAAPNFATSMLCIDVALPAQAFTPDLTHHFHTSTTCAEDQPGDAMAHTQDDQPSQQHPGAPASNRASATTHSSQSEARHDARTSHDSTTTQRDAEEHHGPANAPTDEEAGATVGDYQRQRDDDEHASFWDADLGEFVRQVATSTPTRRYPTPTGNNPVSAAPTRRPSALPEARASPEETPNNSIQGLLVMASTLKAHRPGGTGSTKTKGNT
jgi:hypothetical protein